MAHLEQHIGGVQISVADALAVQVRYGVCHLRQDGEHHLPVILEGSWPKEPLCNGVPQAPAITKLLHMHHITLQKQCAAHMPSTNLQLFQCHCAMQADEVSRGSMQCVRHLNEVELVDVELVVR